MNSVTIQNVLTDTTQMYWTMNAPHVPSKPTGEMMMMSSHALPVQKEKQPTRKEVQTDHSVVSFNILPYILVGYFLMDIKPD